MGIIDTWLQRAQLVLTLYVQFSPHSASATHGSQAGLVRNLCSLHPTVVTLLPFLSKFLFICLFCRSFNLRWDLIQGGLLQRAEGKMPHGKITTGELVVC